MRTRIQARLRKIDDGDYSIVEMAHDLERLATHPVWAASDAAAVQAEVCGEALEFYADAELGSVAYELRRFATNIQGGHWPSYALSRDQLAEMLREQADRIEQRACEALQTLAAVELPGPSPRPATDARAGQDPPAPVSASEGSG